MNSYCPKSGERANGKYAIKFCSKQHEDEAWEVLRGRGFTRAAKVKGFAIPFMLGAAVMGLLAQLGII